MASQLYKTDASQEYVIVGNDVIVKCQYPSFVSDFLSVQAWQDSEGNTFTAETNLKSGNLPQLSLVRILWCSMKKFRRSLLLVLVLFSFLIIISVAHQNYRVVVHEESVILGNDVHFKCNIQSYVADFVQVVSWTDSEGSSFMPDQSFGNFLLKTNWCKVSNQSFIRLEQSTVFYDVLTCGEAVIQTMKITPLQTCLRYDTLS